MQFSQTNFLFSIELGLYKASYKRQSLAYNSTLTISLRSGRAKNQSSFIAMLYYWLQQL